MAFHPVEVERRRAAARDAQSALDRGLSGRPSEVDRVLWDGGETPRQMDSAKPFLQVSPSDAFAALTRERDLFKEKYPAAWDALRTSAASWLSGDASNRELDGIVKQYTNMYPLWRDIPRSALTGAGR